MAILTEQEEALFERVRRTGDWDAFTNYWFRLPKSGTWYTPEDRGDQYSIIYDAWQVFGEPEEEISLLLPGEEQSTTFLVDYNYADYGSEPIFLLHHGFLTLPWLKEFLDPNIPVGVAITGVASGKTAGLAIFGAMCCALFPGFRYLNAAPTSTQANLMLGEIEKWCGNSEFRRLVRPGRGVNPLWTVQDYPTITIEVYEGFPSTFVCQTTARDANNILGMERDYISVDEAALMTNIADAVPKLSTRLRGIRSTGAHRWGLLRWITNPGKNPELTALVEHYRDLQDKGMAIAMTHVPSSMNVYVTKAQWRKQVLGLRGERAKRRWHEGDPSAVYEEGEISEALLEKCKDDKMTELVSQIGNIDEELGLVEYFIPREQDHDYLVIGDAGKSELNFLSSMNVPCVLVFDVTNFLDDPIRLVSMQWKSGGGSYATFMDMMINAMARYRAVGYYDATNVQTALEDTPGSLMHAPTTPIYFSGSVFVKRWALAIIVAFMDDLRFAWPYIRGLWYQAAIYDVRSKKVPDDIVASLLVFALALSHEGTLFDKLTERYEWADIMDDDDFKIRYKEAREILRGEREKIEELDLYGDDRYARYTT